MKDQIKTYKRFYNIFIAVIIVSYSFLIALLFLPISRDIRLSLGLLMIVFLLVFSLLMRPKLFVLSIAYHYARLKEKPGKLIKPYMSLSDQNFKTHLTQKGFEHFKKYQDFSIYYRVKKGDQNFLEKKGILEFFVIISDLKLPFHHDSIGDAINEVEDYLESQKQKYFNYAILNLKLTPTLTDDQIEEADQIIFEKHKNHHIAVINGFYAEDQSSFYMLYSEDYAPTILYHHAVETYQSLIK